MKEIKHNTENELFSMMNKAATKIQRMWRNRLGQKFLQLVR